LSVIAFTNVRGKYGWLGNMSNHPVSMWGVEWRTAEHAFQVGRLPSDHKYRKGGIINGMSPMEMKGLLTKCESRAIAPMSDEDVYLMRSILVEKLYQNSLGDDLAATGSAMIVEDVTKRQRGNSMFWGAALIDGRWVGENVLGKLWMDIRDTGGWWEK